MMPNQLIVYRRERSTIWQCRFNVGGVWQRATTGETEIAKAKKEAYRLRIEAEFRLKQNMPVVTRRFRDVAKLAVQRMQQEISNKNGKASYKDYIRVIKDYLIPILGKRHITSIDSTALEHLDAERIKMMGKVPSKSTMLTQNSALNRVLDEAVSRNLLTNANRPKLVSKGKASVKRPSFTAQELRAVINNFDKWIDQALTDKSKELRQLLRDYIDVLIDTGARPGKELLNLKWNQIKFNKAPITIKTNDVDPEDGEPIEGVDFRPSCEMVVSGKHGTRTIVGMKRTVGALARIAKRNYNAKGTILVVFEKVAVPKNSDYVFRTSSKDEHTRTNKMFESYLKDHNLLVDPITQQKRVLYSLRHTYATLQLTHDKVPIHTLAKQMGTSVSMIEKFYSDLSVVQAIDQLRGEETNKLLNAGGVVDDLYTSKRKPATVQKNSTQNKSTSAQDLKQLK
jgi:integrase